MDENSEKFPLLENNDYQSTGESIYLSNLCYGSVVEDIEPTSSIGRTIIPHNERITYTWTDLNVFATDTNKTTPNTTMYERLAKLRCPRSDLDRRKHILKKVSGIAYPGELLAILGSSGSGKTTLLDALTFRSQSNVIVTGLRCANRVPVTSAALISNSAYVQQSDLFFDALTVKEHLTVQALLRMDRSISKVDRLKRVEHVIEEFSLKNCENTRIASSTTSISGGERKRLSFASKVLTNPCLMVCDEPTSGLDSFMALNVVQNLKQLARNGHTVVCTIHQPSSELYAMFDKMLLLAEGKVAFLGSPKEADAFFTSLRAPCPTNYNPGDFYIQLLAVVPEIEESCKAAIKVICENYNKSQYKMRIEEEQEFTTKMETSYNDFWLASDNYQSPYKASWCTQFRVVLWRTVLTTMKEPQLIKIRFVQTMMVAILIGLIYHGQILDQDGVMNINGVLFTFLTCMTFQNLFAVIQVFCAELPIFLRENSNGMYCTSVYFLCKTLAEIPIFVVLPISFISIPYFFIGLNPMADKFFVAAGVLVLVANVATSFGYLVSCLSKSTPMALSIGPPIIIPLLLFGGYFLNVNSIPPYFQWLSWISWFRFGNEALLINQWRDINRIDCTAAEVALCPQDGESVLQIFNFDKGNFGSDIVMLMVLIISFRTIAFLALLFKVNSRQ